LEDRLGLDGEIGKLELELELELLLFGELELVATGL
jgi:hypothetical protein